MAPTPTPQSCEPKQKAERSDDWSSTGKPGLKMSASAGKIDRPTRMSSLNEDTESLLSRPDTTIACESPAAVKELLRSRSAKQMSWMLLLQAHKAVGFVASAGSGAWSMVKQVGNRLSGGDKLGEYNEEDEALGNGKQAYQLLVPLRLLCIFSIALLAFEAVSHSSELEWQFQLHNPSAHITPLVQHLTALFHILNQNWIAFRTVNIAPYLQWSADSCIWLFLIQSADRIILFLGFMYIKLLNIKPIPKGQYEDDVEGRGGDYPMVLVQMPMCNEKECYDQSIAAVCALDWPKDRLLIQVLDDSSDMEIHKLIEAECAMWKARGAPIVYRHRIDRSGYKAGNLESGMDCPYVRNYEYVAIFDADFQPKPDFLKLTMPHFKEKPDVALVQARWSFVNKDENLLTKLQVINLYFHFEVEQQVNGHFLQFFGFNGTAGVWRIKALRDSGGWLPRTTVEDMDIAVRAHLKGWKFVYVNDVEASCELPESYEAYRKQQHRWHSGPMQLFRLCLPDIISAKMIGWPQKLNLIFLFFLLRKMILPFYSFMLFCIILPFTMFVPEAQLPLWVVCYIPGIMSILNVLPAPKYFPFMIPYLLFENTMSVTKFQAMVAGLFQLKSAHEWVVTKKSGRQSELDLAALGSKPAQKTLSGNALPSSHSAGSQPVFSRIASESALQVEPSLYSKHSMTSTAAQAQALQALQAPGVDSSLAPSAPPAPAPVGTFSGVYGVKGFHGPRASAGVNVNMAGSHLSSVPEADRLLATAAAAAAAAKKDDKKEEPKPRKIYKNELALAALLLIAAARSLLEVRGMHFYFLIFQGFTFLVVGLDLINDRQ